MCLGNFCLCVFGKMSIFIILILVESVSYVFWDWFWLCLLTNYERSVHFIFALLVSNNSVCRYE